MTEYDVQNSAEYAAGSNAGQVLTTTLWNQYGNIHVSINGNQTNLGVEYNKYCPIYSGTTRAVTGCTNTADAQIIYYWLEKGYADQITLVAESSDWFRVGDYSTSSTTVGKIELGTAPAQYGVPDVNELNSILANVDIVPVNGSGLSGGKIDLGNFIAALNFYCGIKNNSDYWEETGTWSYVAGAYYDGTDANVYQASGFDSYYRIAFGGGTVDKKIYDIATDYFTKVGHSILQENLNYGEIIRIDIPGHSIYMDGWREGSNGYEYHLNYGWGNSTATRWYTEAEIANITVDGITIDLSPDTNVVVSNNKSEYWGGSFLRGMERVNHIQVERLASKDDAVEFAFADEIADSRLVLSETAKITSKSDVEFKNINVNLTSNETANLFQSAYALSFEFNDGSISVNGSSSSNIIKQTGSKKVTLTLDDSFIYTGSYTGNTVNLLDDYSYDNLLNSNITASIAGKILAAGAADDVVTLTGNSALLGDLSLGSGSNVLNVESGSIFYGGFSGENLKVNLTINNNQAGAMLVMTSGGEEAFLKAADNTLYVKIDSAKISAENAYTLYVGAKYQDVKIDLTVDGNRYGLFYNGNTQISNPDYQLVYDASGIKISYQATPAEVESIVANPENELDEDGLTNGNYHVTASFSSNTKGMFYRIGEDGEWLAYPPEEGYVTVERNCNVYFKAVNAVGEETEKYETISTIDKDGPDPEKLLVTLSNDQITNQDITLSGVLSGDMDKDFDHIEYYINGESKGNYDYSDLLIESNCFIEFHIYDKRGNVSIKEVNITNIDKIPPKAPVIGDVSNEVVRRLHIDLEGIAEDAARIEYRIGEDGEWLVYNDKTMFEENGTVSFRVVDIAGNISNVTTYEITTIDSTPPDAPEISADKTEMTNENVVLTVVFDLNCGDVAKLCYSVNGNDIEIADFKGTDTRGVYTYKITADHNQELSFYSIDRVGNKSEVKTYVINNIDKEAPGAPTAVADNTMVTNGNVTVNAWFDSTATDIVANQYSFNGVDWFDYNDGVVFEENGKVYFRSVDHVGNVTVIDHVVNNIDKVAPELPVISSDSDGRITDKTVSVWANFGGSEGESEGVKIEYSFNKSNWEEYKANDKIVFDENGRVYFRTVDAAGNESAIVEYKIDNIDDIVDNRENTKIFINSSYTAKNTQGKSLDGIMLVYGKNAFASIEEAKEKRPDDFVSGSVQIVAGKIVDADIDNLENVGNFSAIQVEPSGSFDGEEYSYKTSGKAAKELELLGKAYNELDLSWFKNVSLDKGSSINSVSGGDAKVESSQRYSKDGKTLSRTTTHSNAAVGFFEADGKSLVAGSVEGYLNVEINDSTVRGDITGGKDVLSSQSKVTRKDEKYEHSISEKETVAAAGKIEINEGSSVESIENYKNVSVYLATVAASVSNYKLNLERSEKLNDSDSDFKRIITVTEKCSTDGSISVRNSSVDEIRGYSEVVMNGSQINAIRRVAEDGGAYRASNVKWEISAANEESGVTGKLTQKIAYENGGTLSVAGSKASVNIIENYSKVTINGTDVGSVSNNTYLKSEKSALITWKDKEAYGDQEDYSVLFDADEVKTSVISTREEYAANGSLTVNYKSQVGNVSGFDKVVLNGDNSTVNGITAINPASVNGIICGAYSESFADKSKNKDGIAASGSVTETVSVKSASSVKVTGYTVNGDIAGYNSVSAESSEIYGSINRGEAFLLKNTAKYSTSNGVVDKQTVISKVFTSSGKLNLVQTTLNGNVNGYATVELNKSVAGNIVNNTAVKNEAKYSELWDALVLQSNPSDTLEGFMSAPLDKSNALLLSSVEQYAANGSVTMKNGAIAGKITGYNKVKIAGEAEDLTVEDIVALDDVSGMICGSYKKEITNKISDIEGKNGKLTEKITVAPAANVTVNGYNVSGVIAGYESVKLNDTVVDGNVSLGENMTMTVVTEYKTDSSGNVGKHTSTVVKYNNTGSFSAVDSVICGDVIGYKNVEFKNAFAVGDIRQSDIVKVIDGNETRKLSGTVKLSDGSAVGNITNYSSVVFNNGDAASLENVSKVTVSGLYNSIGSFAGTDSNDSITINKNAVLRVNGTLDFGEGAKDKFTVNGTLVLDAVGLSGVETFAGKGDIAVKHDLYKELTAELADSFAGKLLDLGNTVDGFKGRVFESSDNDSSKAFAWDGANVYEGWLGSGEDIDFVDTVDFITLKVEEDSTLIISSEAWASGTNDVIRIGGKKVELAGDTLAYELAAGSEYIIEINRKDDNSMSYTMTTIA